MRLPIVQILEDGRYFFPLNSTHRNPNFESMRLRVADGNSWYNGAMINVRKRFTGGLQFQAYTYGKSTDEGSQAVGSGDFSNSFQPRATRTTDPTTTGRPTSTSATISFSTHFSNQ